MADVATRGQDNSTVSACSSQAIDPATEAAIEAIEEQIHSKRVDCDKIPEANDKVAPWFWHGFIGPGKLTLMTSQWKAGKTTLISVLLGRMAEGGELAGRQVSRGRVAVICEEGRDEWRTRRDRLGLGSSVALFPRLFQTVPGMLEWQAIVRAMLTLREREGLNLLIIDPLAPYLPGGNENTGAALLRCLLCLRQLTSQGMGVVLLHHPKKGPTVLGQAARGSGVLPGYADIIIEKGWYGKPDETDRRRLLRCFSRYEETPRRFVLELNQEGTDYFAHEVDQDGPDSSLSWDVLRAVLEDTEEYLTVNQMLTEWPEDYAKPDKSTLSRLLNRGVEAGEVLKRGTGRKNSAYQYWLPGREGELNPGPMATPEERERWTQYQQKKMLEAMEAAFSRITAETNAEEEKAQERAVSQESGTRPEAAIEEPEDIDDTGDECDEFEENLEEEIEEAEEDSEEEWEDELEEKFEAPEEKRKVPEIVKSPPAPKPPPAAKQPSNESVPPSAPKPAAQPSPAMPAPEVPDWQKPFGPPTIAKKEVDIWAAERLRLRRWPSG